MEEEGEAKLTATLAFPPRTLHMASQPCSDVPSSAARRGEDGEEDQNVAETAREASVMLHEYLRRSTAQPEQKGEHGGPKEVVEDVHSRPTPGFVSARSCPQLHNSALRALPRRHNLRQTPAASSYGVRRAQDNDDGPITAEDKEEEEEAKRRDRQAAQTRLANAEGSILLLPRISPLFTSPLPPSFVLSNTLLTHSLIRKPLSPSAAAPQLRRLRPNQMRGRRICSHTALTQRDIKAR